jgi:hypothetical protein
MTSHVSLYLPRHRQGDRFAIQDASGAFINTSAVKPTIYVSLTKLDSNKVITNMRAEYYKSIGLDKQRNLRESQPTFL